MVSLGERLKTIRKANNLTQSDLAKIFYVSEKTISSWENNRTSPDLNMIYKISDYFKRGFYYLINDEFDTDNINEIEVKLKVDNREYQRIYDLISKEAIKKSDNNQIDFYYNLDKQNLKDAWLRIRNEDGKYIFNYKKKVDKSHYEKYDVLIDNFNNLSKILDVLNVKNIGTISKRRIKYVYEDKYEFSFDNVNDLGQFIEIELIQKSGDFDNDLCDLLKVFESLKIDLNMVDTKKYVDYLGGVKTSEKI